MGKRNNIYGVWHGVLQQKDPARVRAVERATSGNRTQLSSVTGWHTNRYTNMASSRTKFDTSPLAVCKFHWYKNESSRWHRKVQCANEVNDRATLGWSEYKGEWNIAVEHERVLISSASEASCYKVWSARTSTPRAKFRALFYSVHPVVTTWICEVSV